MDPDMELAMHLQREEELTANDSLLASYLHEEINKDDGTPINKPIHSGVVQGGLSRAQGHSRGSQSHVREAERRNLRQPSFNRNRSEATIDLSDDDSMETTNEFVDIPHHNDHVAHHYHCQNFHNNHNDGDIHHRNHLLTDINMFGNSWPRMPNRTYNRVLPHSVLNGVLGTRRYEATWHPYRPSSAQRLWPSFRINARNLSGNNDYETLWNLGDMIGDAKPKGLNSEELNQLPTSTFVTKKSGSKSCGSASTSRETSSDSEEDECRICISSFVQKEELKILPCLHKFHSSCVDQWLKQNAVCPVCRIAVKEQLQ